MIYLSRAGSLIQQLKLINNVAKNLTPDSVYTHLLLEQVADNILQLTVNTGTCWLSRRILATATVGTKFLASSKDLERFCSKFPASKKLRLVQRKGNLCIEALEEQELSEPLVTDSLMVRLYPGDLSDFQPPQRDTNTLFRLDPATAKLAFHTIATFGGYESDKQPRAVVFVATENALHLYANKQNGSNFYIRLSLPLAEPINTTKTFAINGKNLKYLTDLSNSDLISFSVGDCLFVEGDAGYSQLPLYDLELASNVSLAIKLCEPNDQLNYCGERDVSLSRLLEAVTTQEVDPKETTWREVKLEATGDCILVSKTHDLDRNEFSRVPTVTTSCLATNWKVLSFNTEWFKAGLQAVRNCIKASGKDYVRIQLEYAQLDDSQRWRVLIEPLVLECSVRPLLAIVCQTVEELEYLNEHEA